jgi:hypothetical protein
MKNLVKSDKIFIFQIISKDGEFLVGMTTECEMIYGKNYIPNTAANEFWNCLKEQNPLHIPNEALKDEVRRLQRRNKQLIDENRRLSRNIALAKYKNR